MKTVNVVAAIIKQGRTILGTQRGYGDFAGGWEFPGGKIEPGETPEEALAREIREGLATEIAIGERIGTVEYDYPEFHLVMDTYWCTVKSGELTLLEAEEAKWLTAETIGRVKWLPSDRELIEVIRQELLRG